jgi:hypothetical protein
MSLGADPVVPSRGFVEAVVVLPRDQLSELLPLRENKGCKDLQEKVEIGNLGKYGCTIKKRADFLAGCYKR